MEKLQKKYWKDAISVLKTGKNDTRFEIEFNNEIIDFKEVTLFNRFGYQVPEHLISYPDDSEIDFTDDADFTDTGYLENVYNGVDLTKVLPIENEIKEWIKKEEIDVNQLAVRLIKNFYETVRNVHKKVAL